jgi:hypothetical protein
MQPKVVSIQRHHSGFVRHTRDKDTDMTIDGIATAKTIPTINIVTPIMKITLLLVICICISIALFLFSIFTRFLHLGYVEFHVRRYPQERRLKENGKVVFFLNKINALIINSLMKLLFWRDSCLNYLKTAPSVARN